ncbi:MAG: ABC transporter [Corynebacteriales bacterium]|nr:ABC transporter [Mycobacteriales bacterium]
MKPVVHSLETTASHPMLAIERDLISNRLATLREVCEVLDSRMEAPELVRAHEVAERAQQRLELSATHTVVALAGSTGSGKSSLFNALSGLELSHVGVTRPTTSEAHACIWGQKGAQDLLDWLGVDREKQTPRESPLDADAEARLRGLVLLDLPDHDSLIVENRQHAERMIDRVDMLVWVTDPQKYADAALHEGYLQQLRGRDAVIVVVLNQVDRLSEVETKQCVEHLRELLVADGLPEAPVIATSATSGQGMAELRALLLTAVTARVAGLRRLNADLDEVVNELSGFVDAPARPELDRAPVKAFCRALHEATGASSLADAAGVSYRRRALMLTSWPLGRWIARLRPGVLHRMHVELGTPEPVEHEAPGPLVTAVARAQVETAARDLAERVGEGMPDPWPGSLSKTALSSIDAPAHVRPDSEQVPSERAELVRSSSMLDALGGAVLAAAHAEPSRPPWWRVVASIQWVVFGLTLLGAVWLLSGSLGAALDSSWSVLPLLFRVPIPALIVLVGVVVGPALGALARVWVAKGAEQAQQAVAVQVQTAVEGVAAAHTLAAVRDEMRTYERTRAALTRLSV